MSHHLVLVESPAKIQKIRKILIDSHFFHSNDNLEVSATLGHFRDLETRESAVDKRNSFNVTYKITKSSQAKTLKRLAKEASTVWLAMDLDREGEGIAWHVVDYCNLHPSKFKRITFHEITPSAIIHAFQHPRTLDTHLADAQKSRRVMDRIIGYGVTKYLWKSMAGSNISAGRVQSACMKIITDKTNPPNSILTLTWTWTIKGDFKINQNMNIINAVGCNKKSFTTLALHSEDDTISVLQHIKPIFTISNSIMKDHRKPPPKTLITSTLQQEAYNKLGLSIANTMKIAQDLYEKGLITYMRTDSHAMSNDFQHSLSHFISQKFGQHYLQTHNDNDNAHKKKIGAQEAHECIRPTKLHPPPTQTSFNSSKHERLYDLIHKQTTASHMIHSSYAHITISFTNNHSLCSFIGSWEALVHDGWEAVYGAKPNTHIPSKEMISSLIGQKSNGSNFKGEPSLPKQIERYTEASLVKKLDKVGIGRPSTYVSTIGKLIEKKYVEVTDIKGDMVDFVTFHLEKKKVKRSVEKKASFTQKNRIIPTEKGTQINTFMESHFAKLISAEYTKNMEEALDNVAHGHIGYVDLMNKVDKELSTVVSSIPSEKITIAKNEHVLNVDGKQYVVRDARYGPVIQYDSSKYIPIEGFMKAERINMKNINKDHVRFLSSLPTEIIMNDSKKVYAEINKYGLYYKDEKQKYHSFRLCDAMQFCKKIYP